MQIRRAEKKDTDRVIHLLEQVLEIHAKIRPDIFIPGTTKYTEQELLEIFSDENTPVYVAVDEDDSVVGYAFCVLKNKMATNNIRAMKTFYIDDLCVDEDRRGEHIGEMLYHHVEEEAKRLGCGSITLNVWEGNDSARRFYERLGLKPRNTTMESRL